MGARTGAAQGPHSRLTGPPATVVAMTTETGQHPTWGEEPPPQAAAAGSGWNGRKSLAALAIALGIAAVGGGVIYAASNSEAARGMGGPGYGRGGGGLVMMGGPFGGTQHGEFQNGEVTRISDTSITVESADGFSETYLVDGDTQVNGGHGDVGDIAEGDVVTVIAEPAESADGQATADSIMKGDVVRGGPQRKQGDGRPPGGPDRQGPADRQETPPTR